MAYCHELLVDYGDDKLVTGSNVEPEGTHF